MPRPRKARPVAGVDDLDLHGGQDDGPEGDVGSDGRPEALGQLHDPLAPKHRVRHLQDLFDVDRDAVEALAVHVEIGRS